VEPVSTINIILSFLVVLYNNANKDKIVLYDTIGMYMHVYVEERHVHHHIV